MIATSEMTWEYNYQQIPIQMRIEFKSFKRGNSVLAS